MKNRCTFKDLPEKRADFKMSFFHRENRGQLKFEKGTDFRNLRTVRGPKKISSQLVRILRKCETGREFLSGERVAKRLAKKKCEAFRCVFDVDKRLACVRFA